MVSLHGHGTIVMEPPPAGLIRPGAPFAVGLVVPPDDPPDGAPARPFGLGRLQVALAAYRARFYLLDLVEAAPCTGVTGNDLARLANLARCLDAQAVFVHGLSGRACTVLHPMADELRLTIHLVVSSP